MLLLIAEIVGAIAFYMITFTIWFIIGNVIRSKCHIFTYDKKSFKVIISLQIFILIRSRPEIDVVVRYEAHRRYVCHRTHVSDETRRCHATSYLNKEQTNNIDYVVTDNYITDYRTLSSAASNRRNTKGLEKVLFRLVGVFGQVEQQ